MDHACPPEGPWFDRGKAAFSQGMLFMRGHALDDVLRVLSIVRALHAAGYQRIRACGFLAPSGLYWRCVITARGAGCDRAYVDWYAGMMITAETGRIPVFFADYEIDISGVVVPPPPGHTREIDTAGMPDRARDD